MKRFACVLILLLAVGAPLAAQQPPVKTPPSAQDGFVPVNGPVSAGDTIPAPRLVAIAYGFIWVVLFGYLWSVRSRLARVEREMETVSRRVAARK